MVNQQEACSEGVLASKTKTQRKDVHIFLILLQRNFVEN